MVSKDPAFLFYSSDFLVGVSDLTMQERGQFITLICLQHQKGHLSKRVIDLSVPDVSPFVLDKFQVDDNGCYYNERTEKEIEKRANYCEKQRKRIEARWSKGDDYTTVLPRYKKPHTAVIPGENENENKINNSNIIDSINKVIPTYEEIYKYAEKRGRIDLAKSFYDYYTEGDWKDRDGNEVKNWKQRFIGWEGRNPKKEDAVNSSFDTDDFFNAAVEKSQKTMRERKK